MQDLIVIDYTYYNPTKLVHIFPAWDIFKVSN